jgi:dTDP-glucose 4,6-dehydratase
MRLPQDDLDAAKALITAHGGDALRGRTIFMTGGTGFLGRWLVETALDCGARLYVLTRDANRVRDLAGRVSLIEGDIAALSECPGLPSHCDYVISGATEPASALAGGDPGLFFKTIEGVRHTLDYAVRANSKRILYLSSGAVYGRQPAEISRVTEDSAGAADVSDPQSTYAETKRVGELLCAHYRKRFGLETVIARGFSFIGPHIPLDRGFAAGNFIGNALERTPIVVQGDGTTLRTYLYAADFAVWCWILLLRGTAGRAYNVGSEIEVSIGELAHEAATLTNPAPPVNILGTPNPTMPPMRYVPSTARARQELGLRESIDWRTALRRTYEWYSAQRVEAVS